VLLTACEPIRLKGKKTSCKVYRLDGLQQAGVEIARSLVRVDEDEAAAASLVSCHATNVVFRAPPARQGKAQPAGNGHPPCQGLQRCIGVQAELPSGELRSGQLRCCVRLN